MNKRSLLALGLVVSVAFSCKKADVLPPATTTASPTTATTATSPWKTLANWQSKNYDKTTVFSSSLLDSSITPSVVSKGLVLAYKKTGTAINPLPFSQKLGGTTYQWFYQVRPGGLQISSSVEGSSSATAPQAEHSLLYFVLSPEQLSRLEAQGKTKAALMNLSYEEAQNLLKK